MKSLNGDSKILCVGDMVVDLCVHPVNRLPRPGEQMMTDKIEVFPGGNALNTAIALRRLGEEVAMAGSIGGDALGGLLLDQLEALGLDCRGVSTEPSGTTATTVLFRVKGQDRRYVHSLGVAGDFDGKQVPGDLIPREGIVLIGGYLKLAAWDDETLIGFLRQAREQQCLTVLNVCIVEGGEVDPQRCLRLLEYVDVFAPNEDEARAIAGQVELKNQATVLHEAGARRVIITRGEQGVYAYDGERIIERDIFPVSVVDPSGCGDCFTAGIVSGLRRGWDFERVLEFGCAVGALGATAMGCTNGVPSFESVQRFISEH
jgi:sugar/nucleoside kinase (ribokinase family)